MDIQLLPPTGSLFGFAGKMVVLIGSMNLPVTLGSPAAQNKKMVEFVIIDLPNTAYNAN